MLIYLTMFMLSASLLLLSRRAHSKPTRRLLVMVALLLPSLLAGLRSPNVGTDYQVYGITYFDFAKLQDSIIEYFSFMGGHGHGDYGFLSIVYFSSLFTEETMLEMFLVQLVTVTFVYLGLCKCEKRYGTPVWLAMLLYYFFLFNASLNIMRQCVAVAIAFYAFTLVWEKRPVKCACFMLLAYSFHSSAVLACALPFLYNFVRGDRLRGERNQFLFALVASLGLVAAIAVFGPAVKAFVSLGVLSPAFLGYISGGNWDLTGVETDFPIRAFLVDLFYLSAVLLYYRMANRRGMDSLYFLMISGVVLIIETITPLYAKFLFRMAYFFIVHQVVALANIARLNRGKSKFVWVSCVVFVAFVAWLKLVVLGGGHETVPFEWYWAWAGAPRS